MARIRVLVLVIVSMAVHSTWTPVPLAQVTDAWRAQRRPAEDVNACAASKVEAVGTYMGAVIDCQPRAVRGGESADDRCVQRAGRQLTQRFAAIERAGGCEAVNDAPAAIARVDASVDELAAMLDTSNANRCLRRQLFAMGRDAERQTRCIAEAVTLGAGHSADVACQSRASDRFFAEFARASTHGCTGDAVAIDAAIRRAASFARIVIKPPVSSCAPIEVTAVHGSNFSGNARLAKIENGQVACMHVDDGTIASCAFSTQAGRQSGEWLESPSGRFALVGQAIALDGRPGGEYIVAARVSDAAPAACVESAGLDTLGQTYDGFELAQECTLEEPLAEYNALSAIYPYWSPLYNHANREVCSANNPATIGHPDFATFVRSFSSSGAGPDDTFCYLGAGAGLNDLNGTERDSLDNYYSGGSFCHILNNGGFEVPAAKRQATVSFPRAGIDTRSYIAWRPVNPHVIIANGHDLVVQMFDDRQLFQSFTNAIDASGPLPDLGVVGTSVTVGSVTFSLAVGGNTLVVGASGTPAEPDWYPDLPGNDIAMGYENLQVQFDTPVYAFGFDFVEPNLTMPDFGGTPVDSTFEIVMYLGSREVGRATFNAQDDVVGFVGAWSSLPFDRVTIIDQTGDHDNEYFGQFYTSTVPKS